MAVGVADEPLAVGDRDRLRAAVDAELREDPLDVCGDRLLADHELLGDLPLAPAAREQHEHLALARRQNRRRMRSLVPRSGDGPLPGCRRRSARTRLTNSSGSNGFKT